MINHLAFFSSWAILTALRLISEEKSPRSRRLQSEDVSWPEEASGTFREAGNKEIGDFNR